VGSVSVREDSERREEGYLSMFIDYISREKLSRVLVFLQAYRSAFSLTSGMISAGDNDPTRDCQQRWDEVMSMEACG
jgi:hypothetical protein